jgi:hypothetical protein
MNRMRAFFASATAGVLFSLPNVASPATTCVALPPLKPIHRIFGVVFFPSGDRIANAKVTVLQGDEEIATQQTGKDGKFSFEGLKAGNYEISVRVETLADAYSQVVLTRPQSKSKRELAVNMHPGSCSSISLVGSKQLEAELNPSDSL